MTRPIGIGVLYRVGPEASIQFTEPIMFRVIKVHDWSTYTGWTWLDGYQLNEEGDAICRRTIFVQPAGLRRAVPRQLQRTTTRS